MNSNTVARRLDDEIEAETPSVCDRLPGSALDFCSREGANVLKARIEAYWLARGHNVMVMLHNVGFHVAIRAARYDLRSDMVNGMPRSAQGRKPMAPSDVVFVEDIDASDSDED